jgi:hypothetical protein
MNSINNSDSENLHGSVNQTNTSPMRAISSSSTPTKKTTPVAGGSTPSSPYSPSYHGGNTSNTSTSLNERQQQQILQIQRMKRRQREPVRNPMFLVAMLFFGLLVALFVMAFFTYAPLLCASFVGILYVVGLYLTTESQWRWHDAQEFENRFWTMTAFLFSTALFYIKDSPLAIGLWSKSLGMFLVICFTMGIHFLDRHLHRCEISRKPRLNSDQAMCQNLFKYRATAEEKAKLVSECVERIDRIYLPSTINNMIYLSQVKRQEQKIFRILAGASKDELNFILNQVKLALLFYKVKDHSKLLRSDQSRTLILDLLCTKRLADLSITSRAILLDALMVMKLSAHPMCEKWVRNIILKTSGDDLSNLKTFTDGKGDFHSLHKLVFNDIRDYQIRNDILNHIKREAGVQTAHMRLGTKKSMRRRLQAWRKVLSDVDDTLYSSGGRYPAGIDERYPRHVLYPGVLSFYRELDMGTTGPNEWNDERVGNLVFLSARPHVYKDMSEKKSYAKFMALYEKKGMHTLPTMLAGSLKSGRAFMVQGDLEPMAQKKFDNFCEYYQLYPEFKHIFIGDNGQGDVRAAELIVEKFGSKEVLEAGYFHLVQPIEKTFGYHSKEDLDKWKQMNIVFFHTYVGAAVEAFLLGQIRIGGLAKISQKAIENFIEITNWTLPQDREKARLMMNDDLKRANVLLEKYGLDKIELLTKPQKYPLNLQVRTPFGKAIVRKYRGVDGIYQVDLSDFTSFSSTSLAMTGGGTNSLTNSPILGPQAAPLSSNSSSIRLSPKSKQQQQHLNSRRRMPGMVGYFVEESLVPYVSGEKTPIKSSTMQYVYMKKAPNEKDRVLPLNAVVETSFGIGKILNFRPEDEIYTVQIDLSQSHLMPPGSSYNTSTSSMSPVNNKVKLQMMGYLNRDAIEYLKDHPANLSPRMFAGVRSGIGYITKKLSAIVPSSGTSSTTRGMYAIGTAVETPFGKAIVIKDRPIDRVYEVQLLKMEKVNVFVQEKFLGEIPVSPTNSSRSILSMLGLGSQFETVATTSFPTVEVKFEVGAYVTTPYGEAVVKKYRTQDEVYEVVLSGWKLAQDQSVVAFMHKSQLKPGEIPLLQLSTKKIPTESSSGAPLSSGIFQLFRYRFHSSSVEEILMVPYADEIGVSRRMDTPFGTGITRMSKPYNDCLKVSLDDPFMMGVRAYVQVNDSKELAQNSTLKRRNTFELIETTFSYLRGSWVSSDEKRAIADTTEPLFPKGVLVSTPFGEGIVRLYRTLDKVYVVKIGITEGYFQATSLKRPVRGVLGMPVDTLFGSGLLQEVRANDGVHVVSLHHGFHATSSSIQAFLQPSSICGILKAARGDVVMTPYGSGVVINYRSSDQFYVVALQWQQQHVPLPQNTNRSTSKQTHVLAYIRVKDISRMGEVEKASSGCFVM